MFSAYVYTICVALLAAKYSTVREDQDMLLADIFAGMQEELIDPCQNK